MSARRRSQAEALVLKGPVSLIRASARPGSRRYLLLATLAFVAVLLLGACASSSREPAPGASTLEAATGRGAFGVGVTTFELVDTSRPTEASGEVPGTPERKLVVEVWYPAAPSDAEPEERDAPLELRGAPYPLIVFAHGLSSFRRQSASYTQHLASHGYIVAAPDFPLSNLGTPGGPRLAAVLEQPEDVSFLIDRLLEFNDTDGHLLHGAIDADAIGLTGHSLGALTTLLTVYGPSRDPRVTAALAIASPGCFLTDDIAGDASVPLLVLGGSRDLLTPPASNRRAYEVANSPRYLVEIAGADHTRFADVDLDDTAVLNLALPALRASALATDATTVSQALGGDTGACQRDTAPSTDELLAPERQRELLRAFATPFFDAYLRGSDEAGAFLRDELPSLVPAARAEFELD